MPTIDVSVAILNPAQGLRYHAACPHGRSSITFTPAEVEETSGVEKVKRLAEAHRARYSLCNCHADDEWPARAL